MMPALVVVSEDVGNFFSTDVRYTVKVAPSDWEPGSQPPHTDFIAELWAVNGVEHVWVWASPHTLDKVDAWRSHVTDMFRPGLTAISLASPLPHDPSPPPPPPLPAPEPGAAGGEREADEIELGGDAEGHGHGSTTGAGSC